MSKSVIALAAFTLGAAAGAAGSWYYAKIKFKKEAQDQIDDFLDYQKRKNEKDISEESEEPKSVDVTVKPKVKVEVAVNNDQEEYENQVKESGYVNYSDISKPEKKQETKLGEEKPYVISPEEFGENYDYETITLTYYSDDVLADDNDDIIYDVDALVGQESLTHFGEYEEDSVHVRNDKKKCAFEILLSERTYEELLDAKPYKSL